MFLILFQLTEMNLTVNLERRWVRRVHHSLVCHVSQQWGVMQLGQDTETGRSLTLQDSTGTESNVVTHWSTACDGHLIQSQIKLIRKIILGIGNSEN